MTLQCSFVCQKFGLILHSTPFGFPYMPFPAFTTPAVWCRVFQFRVFSPPPFLQHTWSAPLCESACRCAKRYCMIIIGGGRGQWLGRHHGESGAGAYNGGLGAGSPEAESILVVGCPTEPANLAPFQKCPFELRYTQQSLSSTVELRVCYVACSRTRWLTSTPFDCTSV